LFLKGGNNATQTLIDNWRAEKLKERRVTESGIKIRREERGGHGSVGGLQKEKHRGAEKGERARG